MPLPTSLAITGTPMENYLDELWSLFSFVNPGLLGAREGFQRRFAGPIERDRDPQARQALRALIRPFLLRRTKAEVLSELPPRTEQTVQVEMGEAERAFYEALRQQALESIAALDVAGGQRKLHILAEITRLRRACCNPALIDAAAGVPSRARRCRALRSALADVSPARSAGEASEAVWRVRKVARSASDPRCVRRHGRHRSRVMAGGYRRAGLGSGRRRGG